MKIIYLFAEIFFLLAMGRTKLNYEKNPARAISTRTDRAKNA
jgi:hypothetical protein